MFQMQSYLFIYHKVSSIIKYPPLLYYNHSPYQQISHPRFEKHVVDMPNTTIKQGSEKDKK